MSRDVADLHPCLRPVAVEFVERCAAIGLPVFITHTHRTDAEQQALYNQGRTTPGKIVTRAKPGQSPHNPPNGFPGLAFDVAFKKQGNPYEEPRPGAWKEIGVLGESLGLIWGGSWAEPKTDRPHFEWPDWRQVAAGGDPTPGSAVSGGGS